MSPLKTCLLVAILALCGVGAGLAIFQIMAPLSETRALAIVPVTVGPARLNVPLAYFRGGAAPRSGASERIDLVVHFPEMTAAGTPPGTTDELARQDPLKLLFLTVLRSDGIIDPADRPQELYGRFLEPDAWANPGGLLMRRFEKDSPYEDEELFLSPPDGKAFAARCRKPGKPSEGIGEACIWRFRHEGADLQVRFSPALLPQWEDVAGGVGKLLQEWEAR